MRVHPDRIRLQPAVVAQALARRAEQCQQRYRHYRHSTDFRRSPLLVFGISTGCRNICRRRGVCCPATGPAAFRAATHRLTSAVASLRLPGDRPRLRPWNSSANRRIFTATSKATTQSGPTPNKPHTSTPEEPDRSMIQHHLIGRLASIAARP